MRKLVGVAVLVLLAVACSGGGGSSGGAVDTSHDQEKADAAVLRADDLDGFETDSSSSSSSSSSSDDAADKCFKEATGLDPNQNDKDRTAKAASSFQQGSGANAVSVKSEVEFHKSGDSMSRQLAAFSQPEVQSCLKDAITQDASSRGTDVQFSDINIDYKPLSGLGDEAGEFDISATVTTQGISLPVAFEIDFVRKGRVGLSVFVFTLDGQPDHDLAVKAFDTMLSRLQQ